jgi:hypothetical protein
VTEVRDFLARTAENCGWKRTRFAVSDVYKRGYWTLLVEWSPGKRVAGATLHEAQLDPDTGKPKLKDNGNWRTFLRFGLTARSRAKREALSLILATKDEDLGCLVEDLNRR